MQMDEGLDTGDMLLKKACPIESGETAQSLLEKLAEIGAAAIVEALQDLQSGTLTPTPQNSAQATYANKLTKAEAQLNWTYSATELGRAIRGYNPFPAAYAKFNNIPIKIWQAGTYADMHGEPGTVLAVDKRGIMVACGQGALCLEVLQRPNGKALPFNQFLQGFSIKAGDRFDKL